jgi:hypothetical protein
MKKLNENGQGWVEYGLILIGVLGGLLVGYALFGGQIRAILMALLES